MINKDGGGGQFLDFMGGHSCHEGGHRLMGGENPDAAYLVCIVLVVFVLAILIST